MVPSKVTEEKCMNVKRKEDNMDMRDELMLTAMVTTGTITQVLGAIRKHGLEKTLEDMRDAVKNMPIPYNDEVWQRMLLVVRGPRGMRGE